MDLSDWVINTLERRNTAAKTKSSIRKMGNYISEKLHIDCTGRTGKRLIDMMIVIQDTIKAGAFYLPMIKNLAIISILHHLSTHILLHRFTTVAGYDMDRVIYYLAFIVISSKIAIALLHLANWKLLHGYCYKRPARSYLLIKMCTLVFPVHFAILELSRLKRVNREHLSDLQDVFNDMKKKEEVKKTRCQFLSVLHMMKQAKTNSILVHKFYIQIQLIETILERMPLCVILASLFYACRGKH